MSVLLPREKGVVHWESRAQAAAGHAAAILAQRERTGHRSAVLRPLLKTTDVTVKTFFSFAGALCALFTHSVPPTTLGGNRGTEVM